MYQQKQGSGALVHIKQPLFPLRHRKKPVDYKKAGLASEWDPNGVLFFIKELETAFDAGNICLVWSGLDEIGLDSYRVSAAECHVLRVLQAFGTINECRTSRSS